MFAEPSEDIMPIINGLKTNGDMGMVEDISEDIMPIINGLKTSGKYGNWLKKNMLL